MKKLHPLALRAMLLMLVFSPLMACTSLSNPTPTTATIPNVQVVVKPDCVNWKHETYSAPPDSDATVRQITDNNAAHKKACGF